jgi:hypothetical protein
MPFSVHLAYVLWYNAGGLSIALHAHLFIALWRAASSIFKDGDPFLFMHFAGQASKYFLGMIANDIAMAWLGAQI